MTKKKKKIHPKRSKGSLNISYVTAKLAANANKIVQWAKNISHHVEEKNIQIG